MSITLDPVQSEHDSFLFNLYAGTREAELSQTQWDADQKQAFLKFQFEAQQLDYRNRFADSEHRIILSAGQAVGRLYVSRGEEEIRILDITVLSESRGAGIGTSLLQDLQAEAVAAEKPLRIYVENTSRSRTLFDRLGFATVEDNGLLSLLEWRRHSDEPKSQ